MGTTGMRAWRGRPSGTVVGIVSMAVLLFVVAACGSTGDDASTGADDTGASAEEDQAGQQSATNPPDDSSEDDNPADEDDAASTDSTEGEDSAEDEPAEDETATGNEGDFPAFAGYLSTFDPEGPSELYRMVDGDVELIDQISAAGGGLQLTDLAVSADGEVFGVTFDDLVRIDPDTATAEVIGALGGDGVNALGFLPDDRLLAADLGGAISVVDPATGARRTIARYPAGLASSGDLLAMPDGTVYGTATDGTIDYLGEFDAGTEELRIVNNELPPAVYGLMLNEDGELIGLTYTSASGRCPRGEMIAIELEGNGYEPLTCLDLLPGGAANG